MTRGDLPRSVLWTKFLDCFAERIGNDAVIVARKHVVAWRSDHALNRIELLNWSCPAQRSPHAPHVTRMGLNTHVFTPSKVLLKRFGFGEYARPGGVEGLRLEWTVLDDELLAFADWLPHWIRGRLDPSVPIPLPPHPSHVFGEGLRTTAYAWTSKAWDAYSCWQRQDPRLPRYAIHARDVVPGAPEPRPQRASA